MALPGIHHHMSIYMKFLICLWCMIKIVKAYIQNRIQNSRNCIQYWLIIQKINRDTYQGRFHVLQIFDHEIFSYATNIFSVSNELTSPKLAEGILQVASIWLGTQITQETGLWVTAWFLGISGQESISLKTCHLNSHWMKTLFCCNWALSRESTTKFCTRYDICPVMACT